MISQFSNKKGPETLNQIFITFDVEDFINPVSTEALEIILKMLKKHDLRAIFFITGYMAETIKKYPEMIEMLRTHEIGYHSSSHSVRPAIFEYTDVEDYVEAYETSIQRETSHINPLTGEIEGKGGIKLLQELFSNKRISAYRAPGCGWSPPHLEALRDLGIEFDFSSNISPTPMLYRGITFYPHPVLGDWSGGKLEYLIVLRSVFTKKFTIIDVHPNSLVCLNMWDSNYYNGNPQRLHESKSRNPHHIVSLFNSFELLMKQLHLLQKLKLVEITPALNKAQDNLYVNENDFERIYQISVLWAKRYFNYNPRFLRSHFLRFFNLPDIQHEGS